MNGEQQRRFYEALLAAFPDAGSLRRMVRVASQQDAPTRGWLMPVAHKFTRGEPLFTIQHPEASPLKLSAGSFQSFRSIPERIVHSVSTLSGSSGSPCFTNDWKLVALHNAGPAGGNEAIPFSAILREFQSKNILNIFKAS
jgi:hypothetical protein